MVHPTKNIDDLKEHAREAVRLRSLAHTVTTAATKARVLQQAEEHARLAGHADPATEKSPSQSPGRGFRLPPWNGYLEDRSRLPPGALAFIEAAE